MAAILIIEKNGQFLLVKNLHRPEYYSPIGGVIKYTGDTPNSLAQLEWVSDYTTNPKKKTDMDRDLRGVLKGKNFPSFIDWFVSKQEREQDSCIRRELQEELAEAKVNRKIRDMAAGIQIQHIRFVVEGPNPVEGRVYSAQFRYFDVYKLDNSDEKTRLFIEEIFNREKGKGQILKSVTKTEIYNGRVGDSEKLIASYTKYLFQSDWHGEISRKIPNALENRQ